MHIILEDSGHKDQDIECPHCHWHGSASALKKGEYFNLTYITELFCPHCNKYLGFIQHEKGLNE